MSNEPHQPVATQAGRWDALDWISVALFTVAVALGPLILYPFPSQDGPQHAITAYILGRLSDPGLGFAQYFEAHIPLSSQGFVMLLALLDQWLPFAAAERMALALTLAAFPLMGAYFAKTTGRNVVPVVGLLSMAAYGWVLAMGFYNFLLAFAFLPLVMGLTHRPSSEGLSYRRTITLGLGMLLLAWLHIAVAAFAGLMVVLATMIGPHNNRWLSVFRVVLAGVPAALYVVWATTQHVATNVGHGFVTPEGSIYEDMSVRLSGFFLAGPGAISAVSGVAFFLAVIVIIVSVVLTKRSLTSNRRFGRVFLLVGLVMMGVYFITPLHGLRWGYLSPRLLFAAMVVLALVSLEGTRKTIVRAVFLGVCLVGVISAMLGFENLHSQFDPFNRSLLQIPHRPGDTFVNLEVSRDLDRFSPPYFDLTLHMGTRVLVERGGATPYLFAFNRTAHALTFREDLELPPIGGAYVRDGFVCGDLGPHMCLSEQIAHSDVIAYLYGFLWGELLLFHPNEVLSSRLRGRGFRLAFENELMQFWVAQPGGFRFLFELPAEPIPGEFSLRAGYPGQLGWVLGHQLPPNVLPSGPLEATLGPLMAGPVDVEVFIDTNGNDQPDAGEWLWRPASPSLLPGQVTTIERTIERW